MQFLHRQPSPSRRYWLVGGGLALLVAGGLGMVGNFYVGGVAMLLGLLVVTLGA